MSRLITVLMLLAPFAWADDDAVALEVERYLAAADATKPKPWTAEAALGFTLTDGNSETRALALEIKAEKEWNRWKLFLKENSIYSEDSGTESSNEHFLTERLERALSDKASLFQELFLEHDEQEKLTYRVLLTFGYKRRLRKTEKIELFGEAGGGVLYEDFRNRGTNTEGIAQLGLDLKWKISKGVLFTQVVKVYPSLSEGGEFRLRSETALTTPVIDKLNLKFSIVDKFNSDPPAGLEENDITVMLALVYKFTKEQP